MCGKNLRDLMHYFSICTTEALISSRTKSILESNILCENRSNCTFRTYHGQGPPCSDKGRCRCALSNLNIAMEYTGEGFLFGFVAARHRSSARRFEISYLCACAEVIVSVTTMHWGSPLPFVVLCCRLRALPAELPW